MSAEQTSSEKLEQMLLSGKISREDYDRLRGAMNRIPAGRLGEPSDMAGAALFLASPLAAYVVGQTLVVDGGLSL